MSDIVRNETTVLPTDSAMRKNIPLATGVLDYFPAALAAVAEVSKAGNDKHNPGQPLHWSRGKSGDHADCILRHLADRGTRDPEDGMRHSAKIAWRALALLQEEIEADGAALPRAAWVDEKQPNVWRCGGCGSTEEWPGYEPSDRAYSMRERGGIFCNTLTCNAITPVTP